MQHELIVYWADKNPTSATFNTKMAAVEESKKALKAGAIDVKIRMVSSGQ